MKKTRVIAGILGAVMIASTLSGCQIGDTQFVMSTGVGNGRNVFVINDTPCSIQEAKLYLCNYKNLYGKAYGIDLGEYDFQGESLEQYVKDVTISELSRIFCMYLLADEQEIALDEKEEKQVSDAADAYYESLSADEISYMGIRKSDVVEGYTRYAVADKLYRSLTEGIDEEVSDDEARVIRVQQIYVTNQSIADTVAAKLDVGEDFLTVASSYNEASAIEVTAARGDYPEEVEAVTFEMENDQISGMIPVEGGFYFFRCISKFEQELTEANKGTILIQREKEQFDDVYDDFVANAVAVMNDEVWEEIVFDEEKEITTDSFFVVYDEHFE